MGSASAVSVSFLFSDAKSGGTVRMGGAAAGFISVLLQAESSARCISKEWFYRTGGTSISMCFFLLIGHTSRLLDKSPDFWRCRRPCNVKAPTYLIENTVKSIPFRVTLEILFCFHPRHLISNKSQTHSLRLHQTVHSAVLLQNLAMDMRRSPEHSA